MKPPTGPPKTRRERLAVRWAELQCRVFGHDWQKVSLHERFRMTTGRTCVRCWDTEAKVYPGNYPLPK